MNVLNIALDAIVNQRSTNFGTWGIEKILVSTQSDQNVVYLSIEFTNKDIRRKLFGIIYIYTINALIKHYF